MPVPSHELHARTDEREPDRKRGAATTTYGTKKKKEKGKRKKEVLV